MFGFVIRQAAGKPVVTLVLRDAWSGLDVVMAEVDLHNTINQ
jgi:hypothetical protein